MLTEIYIEALLVDEELADQVWEAWDKGEIDDQGAWLVWSWIADSNCPSRPCCSVIGAGAIKRNRKSGGTRSP